MVDLAQNFLIRWSLVVVIEALLGATKQLGLLMLGQNLAVDHSYYYFLAIHPADRMKLCLL